MSFAIGFAGLKEPDGAALERRGAGNPLERGIPHANFDILNTGNGVGRGDADARRIVTDDALRRQGIDDRRRMVGFEYEAPPRVRGVARLIGGSHTYRIGIIRKRPIRCKGGDCAALEVGASANSLECAVEHPDLDILDSGFVIGRGHADSGHFVPDDSQRRIGANHRRVRVNLHGKTPTRVGHIARPIGDIDSHGVGVISQRICRSEGRLGAALENYFASHLRDSRSARREWRRTQSRTYRR